MSLAQPTEKYAFRMFLNPGCVAENQKRHDEIWPELVTLLQATGISDYSIYLDEQHLVLFAVLRRTAGHTMAGFASSPGDAALVGPYWQTSCAPTRMVHRLPSPCPACFIWTERHSVKDELTLVIDIGKSHAKLLMFNDAGEVVERHGRDNRSVPSALGYPALDVQGLEDWMSHTLGASPNTVRCSRVMTSTHGAALVGLG